MPLKPRAFARGFCFPAEKRRGPATPWRGTSYGSPRPNPSSRRSASREPLALMAGRGAARTSRLTLGPQEPSTLPLPAALFLGLTLVVQLLAARERKLELGAAFLVEI